MDERTNCSVRFVPFRQRISFNVGFRTEIQQKQASIRPKVEAKKGKKSAGKNIEFLFRYYIPSFPPNENFHVYFGEEKLLHESIGLSTFSWLRFNISRSGTFPPIPPPRCFFSRDSSTWKNVAMITDRKMNIIGNHMVEVNLSELQVDLSVFV